MSAALALALNPIAEIIRNTALNLDGIDAVMGEIDWDDDFPMRRESIQAEMFLARPHPALGAHPRQLEAGQHQTVWLPQALQEDSDDEPLQGSRRDRKKKTGQQGRISR